MEQAEKFELLDRQYKSGKPDPSSYPGFIIIKQEKGKQEQQLENTDHSQLTAKAVNVFGKELEPICDYLRCHHEFSVHGLRDSKCRCKHPQNAATGA
jgi:hypothetical protein